MQDSSNCQAEAYPVSCEGLRSVDSSGVGRPSETAIPNVFGTVVPTAAAEHVANDPYRQPVHSEQAIDITGTVPHRDALEPDLLLPEDVLQRARSIINEHLAEHQMPLVESLSDFSLNEVPPGRMSADPKASVVGQPPGRTATQCRSTENTAEYVQYNVVSHQPKHISLMSSLSLSVIRSLANQCAVL